VTQVAQRAQLVTFKGAPATSVALKLPQELTFDEWQEIGELVVRVANASAWWIGDWVTRGQWDFGASYREAIEKTGLDYGTLRNYAWVAGKFAVSRRRDKLSFAHHAVVAALTQREQDRWLDIAESERLSAKALAAAIAAAARAGADDPHSLERLTFAVEPARVERWQTAAELAGVAFDVWAADALDEAAERRAVTRG
jgi:hypothetical protein